jgi:DNA-binding MarR family transcriptional regulator
MAEYREAPVISQREGTRSIELARRAAISKQAAGKTLRELEDAGLLERIVHSALTT